MVVRPHSTLLRILDRRPYFILFTNYKLFPLVAAEFVGVQTSGSQCRCVYRVWAQNTRKIDEVVQVRVLIIIKK